MFRLFIVLTAFPRGSWLGPDRTGESLMNIFCRKIALNKTANKYFKMGTAYILRTI